MKEISVLGIKMNDLSLREALRAADDYMESSRLNTICFLNTELLLKTKDDLELKSAIQGMDMPVAGSVDILSAGGITSRSRRKEVEGNFLIREILHRLAQGKRKVFLLGTSQDALVHMREQFLSVDNKLTFFGSFALDGPEKSNDAIINEINSVVPDVIISVIPSPKQELLMAESRNMVNSSYWVSLQPEMLENLKKVEKKKKKNVLSEFINRFIFRTTVKNYAGAGEKSEKSEKTDGPEKSEKTEMPD